jgi:hypothetical protein
MRLKAVVAANGKALADTELDGVAGGFWGPVVHFMGGNQALNKDVVVAGEASGTATAAAGG